MKQVYELVNICKNRKTADGEREILRNINLSIKSGEFVCIMGPTGCGKSSLMQLLCGIESYTDGILLFEDTEIKNGMNTEMLRRIGVAYQSDNLFEWQTVRRNMENPIRVFKLKKQINMEERVQQMLELTGLKNYGDCYPHELSGGMRQRCAFGRALAHDPDILLLDQPFGALDAITRKVLGIELLKMWKQAENKTVVMVTNSVSEALMLAQRVVVLSAAPATVTKELQNPLTYEERTAELVGNPTFTALSEELNELVHSK